MWSCVSLSCGMAGCDIVAGCLHHYTGLQAQCWNAADPAVKQPTWVPALRQMGMVGAQAHTVTSQWEHLSTLFW